MSQEVMGNIQTELIMFNSMSGVESFRKRFSKLSLKAKLVLSFDSFMVTMLSFLNFAYYFGIVVVLLFLGSIALWRF